MKNAVSVDFSSESNSTLLNLCGSLDINLNLLAKKYAVSISRLGSVITIKAENAALAKKAKTSLVKLMHLAKQNEHISEKNIHLTSSDETAFTPITLGQKNIFPATMQQNNLVKNLQEYIINFAIGPAGSGKTFLAVAYACSELNKGNVDKIILVRPAVEAGEKLGFLPGDLEDKIDPFLMPLFDAIEFCFGKEKADYYIEKSIIEVAPLAFMRGRTLANAMIILDEAQNATITQMKMLLTRIGSGSKIIVTGDKHQTDLHKNIESGLSHAARILCNNEDIAFTYLTNADIVRHKIVKDILLAYENASN